MSVRGLQLAAVAYVLLLALVALEVPLALNLSKRVDAEIKAEAASQAQLVAASSAGRLDSRDDLATLTRTAAGQVGGRVIVVDSRGRLLADSAGTGLTSASYADRPEIVEALRGGVAQGKRYSDSLGAELLFTAVPILEGARRVGAVRVTQSMAEVRSEVRRDVLALIGLGLAALVLGLVVAWLLAGFLSRPLRGLTATARRVEAGELDARAAETGAREHREVAHAFNDMTARLQRSLQAQRDFAANAAHQLRTPLTGLRLRLESAALKTDDPALRQDLDAGERETERLARTVTDLLALAREGERPTPVEPLDLARALRSAGERWGAVADERGSAIELRTADGPVAAAVSAEDVDVILDNLIENALEHAPRDTAVAVELGADAAWAKLAVSDEGPGLQPGEEERAFERFFRGSSRAQRPTGSGLGLTIVRVLSRRWGGEATIANGPQGGARAEVRLPRMPTAALEPELEPTMEQRR